MRMCQQCNRDTGCLHENPLSPKELYFFIAVIVFFSQLGFALFFHLLDSRSVVGISLIGYGSLFIILIILLLMYFMFDKQYLALFFGCHQIKERSFHVLGVPFILCARCTGILIGIFLSIVLFILEINLWYLFFLVIPLFIDGLLQQITKYQSNNITRLITGMLFAPGFVMFYGYLNYYIHYGINFIILQIINLL